MAMISVMISNLFDHLAGQTTLQDRPPGRNTGETRWVSAGQGQILTRQLDYA